MAEKGNLSNSRLKRVSGIRPPAERPLTRLAPARSARAADIREYPRPGRATQAVDIPEYPRLAERPAEHWSPIGPPSLIR